jgi:hypothetical protein
LYFDDLAPFHYPNHAPELNVLSIGWLSRDHVFETGAVPFGFVEALQTLVASPVDISRGMHLCDFCPPPPVIVRNGLRFIEPPPEITSNGVIRVRDLEGRTYVAPVLTLHYVRAHAYKPPEAFIRAVLGSR